MNIVTSVESVRGCGYRKPSAGGVGIYLMGEEIFKPCERLPFPLHVCPTCGEGVKQARGWTWVVPQALFAEDVEPLCMVDPNPGHMHNLCFLCSPREGRAGLLWVGELHYPTAREFMVEAGAMGISRKIGAIPHDFEAGKTVVYLAHPNAVQDVDGDGTPVAAPGIMTVFRPTRVDLVVDTDDPAELPDRAVNLAEKLGEHGRLVRVIPADEPANLFEGGEDE